MATTDAKSGFRLPWSSDRSNPNADPDDAETADAAAPQDNPWPETDTAQGDAGPPEPATEPAGHHETPSEGTVSAQVSAPVTARKAPAKPTKFLADLTKAMQAAAESAREQTLTQFQTDAKTFVELIHERSAGESATLKAQADADIDGIRTWSKAEIARIREETEEKISARKVDLEAQVEAHAGRIERQIEAVHGSVSAFEREMATFFEELLEESDPARFAAMAETLPEPPSFEDILPEAFETVDVAPAATAVAEPASDDETAAASELIGEADPAAEITADVGAPATVDEQASVSESIETGEAAEADPRIGLIGDMEVAAEPAEAAETSATEDTPGSPSPVQADADGSGGWPTTDFDTAEAEAALAARMDAVAGEPEVDGDALAERLAALLPQGPAEAAGAADEVARSTQVVVVGLVSVASIASFKRHLGRVPGVQAVGVSSGPDGEFVFTVTHGSSASLSDAIPQLPGFAARVTGTGDGVVNVTARDPESEA
jgi:hypothetical protein